MTESSSPIEEQLESAAATLRNRLPSSLPAWSDVKRRVRRRQRSRMVGVAMLIGVIAASAAFGLGGHTLSTSTGPGSQSEQAGLAPYCEDIPELGPVQEGGKSGADNPPPDLIQAVQNYQAQHPDTAAGIWIDSAHGQTVVLAFTDDAAPHREAIAKLRVSPNDTPIVQPPRSFPDATTVGESSWAVDVVQARFTETKLRELESRARALSEPAVTIADTYPDLARNRLMIRTMATPDETARRFLADELGADRICVPEPSPTLAQQAGQPEPTSLIPAETADPLVTCDNSSAFLASQRKQPTPLPEGDPLLDALREAIASKESAFPIPGSAEEYLIIGRTDTNATVAQGPTQESPLLFNLVNDRWVLTGTGQAGGQSCPQPRVVPPPGLVLVDWGLDPRYPAPQPGDTVVHVAFTPHGCGGALQPPEYAMRGDMVLVGLATAAPPPAAFQMCGGPTGSTPTTISLPEPLGNRRLLDGTWWPPKSPPIADDVEADVPLGAVGPSPGSPSSTDPRTPPVVSSIP